MVNMPNYIPGHEYIKDLKPLGWIHSQPNELPQMAPVDVTLHSKMLQQYSNWDGDRCIVVTCSFTPGSCSLTAYKLTPQGYDWGVKNKDMSANPPGYQVTFFERV